MDHCLLLQKSNACSITALRTNLGKTQKSLSSMETKVITYLDGHSVNAAQVAHFKIKSPDSVYNPDDNISASTSGGDASESESSTSISITANQENQGGNVDTICDNSSEKNPHKIGVHFPTNIIKPKVPMIGHEGNRESNLSRETSCGYNKQHKIAKFYVGNIDSDITEEILWGYMRNSGIEPTYCRLLINRKNSNVKGAQINVHGHQASIISRRNFWPKGSYVRQWRPRSNMNSS